MKFSVVIPLFNKARYVPAAVASALAQTLPAIEVLVIDDGSTDGGLQALGPWARDPRLRLVAQSNHGVSAARNLGIEMAQGDWVAFLDADDQWHPRFLEALSWAHRCCPRADLLATGFRRVTGAEAESGAPISDWSVPERLPGIEVITDLRRRWMRRAPLCASSVAIRAARLRGMGRCFAEGESYGEDLDMWFRLADYAPVATVAGDYVTVRGDLCGALSRAAGRTLPPFLARMRRQALDGTLPARHRRSALWFVAQSQVTLAREALAEGGRAEALHWLWQTDRGWRLRRWWVTLALALCMPAPIADSWQRWRLRHAERLGREAT